MSRFSVTEGAAALPPGARVGAAAIGLLTSAAYIITAAVDVVGAAEAPVPLPYVTFAAVSVSGAEGNSGTKTLTFTATRTTAVGAATAPVAFAAGGTSAADFAGGVLPSGLAFAWADGATTATLAIGIKGDTDVETDESFTLTMTAPGGYQAGAIMSATGTILNDDAGSPPATDVARAQAFNSMVRGYELPSGTSDQQATALMAALPAIKVAMNVGLKVAPSTLIPGNQHPDWNAAENAIIVQNARPNITGYDVQGYIWIGGDVTVDVTISNCLIRATAAGAQTTNKVKKDNSDALYKVDVIDCALEDGQANDYSRINFTRSSLKRSGADFLQGGNTGGGDNWHVIDTFWGETPGYGTPGAHADGIQQGHSGPTRLLNTMFFAPAPSSPYTDGSQGPTNALRIDGTVSPYSIDRFEAIGGLFAWGGYFPLGISAGYAGRTTRNITLAHLTIGPKAFKFADAGDEGQIHASFTDHLAGGGLIENVLLHDIRVFGWGPILYKDRHPTNYQPALGIWHYNPATLDAHTLARWKELGALDAAGNPLVPVRSVAGKRFAQTVTPGKTGATALGLDLSQVPDDAVITLKIPNRSGLYALEYVA